MLLKCQQCQQILIKRSWFIETSYKHWDTGVLSNTPTPCWKKTKHVPSWLSPAPSLSLPSLPLPSVWFPQKINSNVGTEGDTACSWYLLSLNNKGTLGMTWRTCNMQPRLSNSIYRFPKTILQSRRRELLLWLVTASKGRRIGKWSQRREYPVRFQRDLCFKLCSQVISEIGLNSDMTVLSSDSVIQEKQHQGCLCKIAKEKKSQ